jgi:hypothetical protein
VTTAPSPPRRQARLAESVLLTTSPAARARAIDHPKGQPAAAARWWRRRQPADANTGEKAATGAMRPYQSLGRASDDEAGTHPQSLHPKSGPADHSVPADPESTPPTSTAEPPWWSRQDPMDGVHDWHGPAWGMRRPQELPMRRLAELPGETDSEPGAAGGDEGRASTAGMRHRADYDRKELQVAQGSDGAALPPGCRSLAAQTHSSAATAVR